MNADSYLRQHRVREEPKAQPEPEPQEKPTGPRTLHQRGRRRLVSAVFESARIGSTLMSAPISRRFLSKQDLTLADRLLQGVTD